MWQVTGQCLLTTTCIIDSMPNFTRGAIVLEGDLPFGADFYYGIKSPVLPGLILQVNDKENEKWEFSISSVPS